MSSAKRITVVLIVLIFYMGINNAYAQLWRYLNDSPESEKAYEKSLDKEACSVVNIDTLIDNTAS